ncbi:rieske domain protein [Mycobacterium kansasii 662]|uniref:Rieske domain protein n=1 Tax=Mycobacterium kansasii 662 TaxID=1299326 RepID=X7XSS6_MYCKA|nr:rieske domain protein [Mycobacterium kansasii 662]
MDHNQLIDLTRRALKLARDQTTDLAPRQHTVHAREYTSLERHERDRAMLMSSPQLSATSPSCRGPARIAPRRCWGDPCC